jgi:cytochrome c oxidase assembly protein subunit 11
MTENDKRAARGRNNGMLAVVLGGVFVGMIGMTYASVPLYRMICQVTGYGGTVRRATTAEAGTILDRTINVRFDANTSETLPWSFHPLQREITVKIGATAHAKYEATNLADHPTTGRAIFNVTPDLAGSYFDKVQCFCFTNQTLAAGESKEMDVEFYVDPDIVKSRELTHIQTITLSYTMYPVDASKPLASTGTDDVGAAKAAKL